MMCQMSLENTFGVHNLPIYFSYLHKGFNFQLFEFVMLSVILLFVKNNEERYLIKYVIYKRGRFF